MKIKRAIFLLGPVIIIIPLMPKLRANGQHSQKGTLSQPTNTSDHSGTFQGGSAMQC